MSGSRLAYVEVGPANCAALLPGHTDAACRSMAVGQLPSSVTAPVLASTVSASPSAALDVSWATEKKKSSSMPTPVFAASAPS